MIPTIPNLIWNTKAPQLLYLNPRCSIFIVFHPTTHWGGVKTGYLWPVEVSVIVKPARGRNVFVTDLSRCHTQRLRWGTCCVKSAILLTGLFLNVSVLPLHPAWDVMITLTKCVNINCSHLLWYIIGGWQALPCFLSQIKLTFASLKSRSSGEMLLFYVKPQIFCEY